MIQLSHENIESVGRGYLLKVCYKKVPVLAAATAGLIIESNMTPPEMGLWPLEGLLQSLKILGAVSKPILSITP